MPCTDEFTLVSKMKVLAMMWIGVNGVMRFEVLTAKITMLDVCVVTRYGLVGT
jgi:hypothetical protein